MPRPVEEVLYPALEDFNLDVVLGKGPDGPLDPAGAASVHAGRRHHPPGPADAPAPGAVRLLAPPRLLLGRGPGQDRDALGRDPRRCRSTATRPRRSPDARAARRGSPTGCSGGCGISPRCATTARSRSRSPRRASRSSRSTIRASIGWTIRSSQTLIDKFGGGPVGLSTLAASVGEETDTVEDVVEPYLLQLGFLRRTPRGPGRHRARVSPPGHVGPRHTAALEVAR